MIRVAILASGKGSNARAILRAIRAGRLDAEVPVIVCNRARAGVLDAAAEFGVAAPVVLRNDFPTRTAQQLRMLEILQEARVDLVALAGWSTIFKPPVLRAYPNRILNIHPSLLPAFAGSMAPRPIEDALRAGVKITGCTVHLVVEGQVDAGPLVAQSAVPVLRNDSVASLWARIQEAEHKLYPLVLQWFAEGRVRVDDGGVRVESKTGSAA